MKAVFGKTTCLLCLVSILFIISITIPAAAYAKITVVDNCPENNTRPEVTDITLSYIRYHVHKWLEQKPPSGSNVSSHIPGRVYLSTETQNTIKYAIDDELARDPLALSTIYSTNFHIGGKNSMCFIINNICLFKEQDKYEQQVLDVINPVLIRAETMSDEDKLRFYHDWICETTRYDYEAIESLMTPDNSHAWSAYGAFVEGKAVCVGYARAFQILCLMSDIDCETLYASGNKWHAGHTWNLVHLNGETLYVDVCSDDGIRFYDHDCFLKTKEEMLDEPMAEWYRNAFETADMYNGQASWKDCLNWQKPKWCYYLLLQR